MQLAIKIKENGKWRGLTLEEIGNSLSERIANLAEKETVVKFVNDDNKECYFCTGEWIEHYKSKGNVCISLTDLVLLLDLHPTIHKTLKTLGGEILTQETLGL